MTWSHCSGVIAAMLRVLMLMPAELIKKSSGPSSFSCHAKSFLTLSRSATSTSCVSIGGLPIQAAAAERSTSPRRPAMATRQPSPASAWAIPSPMPLPPPVTKADLPASFMSVAFQSRFEPKSEAILAGHRWRGNQANSRVRHKTLGDLAYADDNDDRDCQDVIREPYERPQPRH